jgi:hypothetical protein
MQVLVAPLTTPGDDEGHDHEFQVFSNSLNAAQSTASPIVIQQVNLGLGADWLVFMIDLAMWVGAAVLVVPHTHKYVRESYEECKTIHSNILALIDKVRAGRNVVRYPIELLYLEALRTILAKSSAGRVRFLSHSSIPVPDALTNGFMALQHHLFVFEVDSQLRLVAIDSDRQILWERAIDLPSYATVTGTNFSG